MLNMVSGRGGAFDWFFQRVSGVVLAVCFAVHLIVLHFMGDGVITYETVMERLSRPGWKAFDLVFLFFGLYHSVTGGRMIVDDYVHHPMLRSVLTALLWILAVVLFFVGLVIIMSLKAPAGV
jgi:succinate dehydrogenase hydrophobic membrane anchor protein